MKKIIAWTLVAVMALGVFMAPVQAVEKMNTPKQITEGPRGGRGGRGGRHGGGRGHRRSNSGWGWAIGGAIAGAAIGSAIANNNNSSNHYYYNNGGYYYRPAEPVLVCDQFGNCYYTYR